MCNEILVIIGFLGLQLVFAYFHHIAETKMWQRVMSAPVIVVLSHPTVAHTLQDYAIHFVIYSGKIISH